MRAARADKYENTIDPPSVINRWWGKGSHWIGTYGLHVRGFS